MHGAQRDNATQRRKNLINIKYTGFIGFCLLTVLSSCVWNDPVCYIPEVNLHLKLRGDCIYFSKTDTFGSDYIDFNCTQVTAPDIYYVAPDTIYVVDKDSYYVNDINSEQFKIKYINHIYPPELTLDADSATFYGFLNDLKRIERDDSVLKAKPHYHITFHDNASGITVFDPNAKMILNQSAITFIWDYFTLE